MRFYGYWRSSASWRVRIALAFKGLDAEVIPVNLVAGEQSYSDYTALNPQGLVPFLIDGGAAIGQSLAIIEYLDEAYPEPALLPGDAAQRARIRMLADVVACDIHPINNLRVLRHLRKSYALEQEAIDAWARHWITAGFYALEKQADAIGGRYMAGDAITLADLFLVPQLYNARRISTDLSSCPRLLAIEKALLDHPAFATTHPDRQPEAQA